MLVQKRDTEQGRGMQEQLQFVTQQLEDKINLWTFIRLLSLFEYMLEDSGSAENKEILLFSHDKLSLASILRPLHQVTKATIVVPYIPKTADRFKRICKSKNIQVHFKGTNTLRTTLVNPKDKDHKSKQTGVIYQYQCPHIQCSSSYIGESGRSLGDRVKEHLKAPSPIHLHSATTGHPLDPNQFNIIHKEVQGQSRTIKEAMFICVQDPPSIATLANTNCHTFGTNFCNLCQYSNPSQLKDLPTYSATTPLLVPPLTPPLCCPFMWGTPYFSHNYSYW